MIGFIDLIQTKKEAIQSEWPLSFIFIQNLFTAFFFQTN